MELHSFKAPGRQQIKSQRLKYASTLADQGWTRVYFDLKAAPARVEIISEKLNCVCVTGLAGRARVVWPNWPANCEAGWEFTVSECDLTLPKKRTNSNVEIPIKYKCVKRIQVNFQSFALIFFRHNCCAPGLIATKTSSLPTHRLSNARIFRLHRLRCSIFAAKRKSAWIIRSANYSVADRNFSGHNVVTKNYSHRISATTSALLVCPEVARGSSLQEQNQIGWI